MKNLPIILMIFVYYYWIFSSYPSLNESLPIYSSVLRFYLLESLRFYFYLNDTKEDSEDFKGMVPSSTIPLFVMIITVLIHLTSLQIPYMHP